MSLGMSGRWGGKLRCRLVLRDGRELKELLYFVHNNVRVMYIPMYFNIRKAWRGETHDMKLYSPTYQTIYMYVCNCIYICYICYSIVLL